VDRTGWPPASLPAPGVAPSTLSVHRRNEPMASFAQMERRSGVDSCPGGANRTYSRTLVTAPTSHTAYRRPKPTFSDYNFVMAGSALNLFTKPSRTVNQGSNTVLLSRQTCTTTPVVFLHDDGDHRSPSRYRYLRNPERHSARFQLTYNTFLAYARPKRTTTFFNRTIPMALLPHETCVS